MTSDRQPKVAEKPARERVYLHVREQILRGRFPGGSFIEEEGEIAAEMGVSRTPVREAFQRLEAEGFIDLLPRRGAQVRQVTAQELTDLYETRRMIEGYAVTRICREKLPVPPEMAALLAEMNNVSNSDHFTSVELNRQFHHCMVAAISNTILAELYRSLGARQQRVAMRAIAVNPERIARIRVEHEQLLAALNRHDEVAAMRVLEEHLRPVAGVVSRLSGWIASE